VNAKRRTFSLLATLALASCSADSVGVSGPPPAASTSAPSRPKGPGEPRQPVLLTHPLDETHLVTLARNTRPEAQSRYDRGPVPSGSPIDHLQLVLKRSPSGEAALRTFIDALHDLNSPQYHRWLTPEAFGSAFGVAAEDLSTVSRWLRSHGFRVDGTPAGRMFVEFSGTVGQVREAFHTEIHSLEVGGVRHIANMSDPSIPAELTPVVAGVHALHDFMPRPAHHEVGPVRRHAASGEWSLLAQPDFTISGSSTSYAVAPPDFATIYDLGPLFSAGFRGAGQTVAVIENTNLLQASDVASFRSAFGLSGYAGTFRQVQPTGSATCINPGVTANEAEAALDAEWAGASAPDAAIELASCADTTTVFGGLIAVQNLINGASVPQILSVSYSSCEVDDAADQSWVNAFQQAAVEGVSVFVAAGDAGAAACDSAASHFATGGIAVNAIASTPYDVAVGGTDFMDLYDSGSGGPARSTYWRTTNGAAFSSARSYVPEIPWNDSCAGTLLSSFEGFAEPYGSAGFCASTSGASFLTVNAGGGGASTFSAQPAWQTGVPGLPTPSGGMRVLPDVALFSGDGVWGHFYVYCMSDPAQHGVACDYTNTSDSLALAAGGTSFASPAFAGIQALVNQKTGSSQGNPNYTYYRLAAAQSRSGGASCNSDLGAPKSPVLPASGCVFNDVTAGDIDVPCEGTNDCYGSATSDAQTIYGALSTSSTSFSPAYPAGAGWDFATGLGTVNANNLVNAFASNATPVPATGSGGALLLAIVLLGVALGGLVAPAPLRSERSRALDE
jgi:subtilase family serine protease